MKHRNGGFSLVEIVAAIAILGMFFAAACSSLVLGLRMNEKTDSLLQNQLAVSSAVETLMAEGISSVNIDAVDLKSYHSPAVGDGVLVEVIRCTENTLVNGSVENVPLPYYEVTVTSAKDDTIFVTTHIREVTP